MVLLDLMQVYLDFLLPDNTRNVTIISFFDRSLSNIKAFGACLNCGKKVLRVLDDKKIVKMTYDTDEFGYQVYIQPIVIAKDKFYHAVAISKRETVFLMKETNKEEQFYSFLMRKFDLPLMKEWGATLYTYFLKNRKLIQSNYTIKQGRYVSSQIAKLYQELRVYTFQGKESDLEEGIKDLFAKQEIWITKKQQKSLKFENMDAYFNQYGTCLVKNLEKTINPLQLLTDEVTNFTLKHMKLYPQQIAQVNGMIALLQKSQYGIINHGMGTGKTICAAAVAEGYFVNKWLHSHPNKTLKDAYCSEKSVVYRNIVMCPGHLVKKWEKEIVTEIPYAKAIIINSFATLLQLKEHGSKRDRKEFYICSKDFGKISYQVEPIPVKRGYAEVFTKKCKQCGEVFLTPGPICPNCHQKEYELLRTGTKEEGMICPFCNKILLPYVTQGVNREYRPLDFSAFTNHTSANSHCFYCGEELWQPHAANIGNKKKKMWDRVTYYRNAEKKGKKTVWVHKQFKSEYSRLIGKEPLKTMDGEIYTGSRKYSPVEFIKRYLKNFFDIAIFDEAHVYKSGNTGQGHAMHALCKSSKKQLALTGTIAGGYANHLFYLLYRLDSKRMKQFGYQYSDEIKFVQNYGKLEQEFCYADSSEEIYNICTKGKQKSAPKVKPGISPRIFMDFLLDRTTFLDLCDMSQSLPELKEEVVVVEPESKVEQNMFHSYINNIKSLKEMSREKGGQAILGKMLHFALSYLDKPYQVSPILSPVNGSIIIEPASFNIFQSFEWDDLLSKERKLISLIQSELKEGRNCFVYAEYTASPETCITYRLQQLIERYCDIKGKVAVLESSFPQAPKREEWIHKKAKEGTKVFITNPRCVETGLDFCFEKEGIKYNYPTIIFYQMGYSMFTNWQASRRSYRLNQYKECRVFYMAFAKSIQETVIELIAEKQAATAAIQGQFSTEGLSAMANGVDVRIRLANSLAQMDSRVNHLQEMFDVIAHSKEKKEISTLKMLTFQELLGDILQMQECTAEEIAREDWNIWNLFNFDSLNANSSSQTQQLEVQELVHLVNDVKIRCCKKRKLQEQMSLFD